MKEIPTALELYYETENRLQVQMSMMDVNFNEEDIIRRAMIDYAKLHVQAALKAASENAGLQHYEFKEDWMEEYHNMETDSYGDIIAVDKDSILSAYPLTNIK